MGRPLRWSALFCSAAAQRVGRDVGRLYSASLACPAFHGGTWTGSEVDDGGSGGGSLTSAGAPFLNLTGIAIGTLGQGVDWTQDPSLFILDFQAVAVGTGFISTSGQCLNSHLQNYGCGLSARRVHHLQPLPRAASRASGSAASSPVLA